jgi:uncharacterized protein YjbI with pentapeptide repeats
MNVSKVPRDVLDFLYRLLSPADKAKLATCAKKKTNPFLQGWQGENHLPSITHLELIGFMKYDTTSLDLSKNSWLTNSDIRDLPKTLTHLNLAGTKITGLENLAQLPLKHLNLEGIDITDIRPLAQTLTHLNLAGTKITGLINLAQLPLKYLNLKCTDVNIGPLPRTLTHLNLAGTDITDELVGLSQLPLKHLDLAKTKITDTALVYLDNLGNLVYLNLAGTDITDDGLVNLTHLPLRHIVLAKTKITDTGLLHLDKSLEHLNCFGNKNITEKGIHVFPKLKTLTISECKMTICLSELEVLHTDHCAINNLKCESLKTLTLDETYLNRDLLKGLELESLALINVICTDMDLENLKGTLKRLSVTDNITGKGLQLLSKLEYAQLFCESLKDDDLIHISDTILSLELYCPEITDVGLSYLSKKPNLRFLSVSSRQITTNGLEEYFGGFGVEHVGDQIVLEKR